MLPYFYIQAYDGNQRFLTLDEGNSRHVVQVLRMQQGANLHLTDGRGQLLTATITRDHKKHCEVEVLHSERLSAPDPEVSLALAPTKNNSRFEWFLEKATELGVRRIIPLLTARTEKLKLKTGRLEQILISAMLQSRQTWLPEILDPLPFNQLQAQPFFSAIPHKFIAHCLDTDKKHLRYQTNATLVLIGPEGDFTPEEIESALDQGYLPVSLGATRLRTETAGMTAAALLRVPRDPA